MASRIKAFLLFVLLLLIPLSSGIVEGFEVGSMQPSYSLNKVGVQVNLRKRLMVDAFLDYDDAGANPKHDPKKKPGKP